jgi:hypothetical protein
MHRPAILRVPRIRERTPGTEIRTIGKVSAVDYPPRASATAASADRQKPRKINDLLDRCAVGDDIRQRSTL